MRALVQRRLGALDLELVEDHPTPGHASPGTYLIRVTAAGVNFADVLQAHGRYHGGPEAPYVAGFEAAGEIIDIGTDIAEPLPVGTQVVGTGPGAFAEYMVMPAAEAHPVPVGWSPAQALGMILNWATALAALRTLGDLKTGETVLIHAAAGGVGQAAIHLAHHYGTRVITTASPNKHDLIRKLGVREVFDPEANNLAKLIRDRVGHVDLVLESVGRTTFETSIAVAAPITGRVVVFGSASGDATISTHDLVFNHPIQLKGLHIGTLAQSAPNQYRELLNELQAHIQAGVYPPSSPASHPLEAGPNLLRRVAAGHTSGKHVLVPGP